MAIEQQHIITDKTLIRAAKAVSVIFTPFSIPFVAFLILFVFSYLRIMPLQYKLIVLGVVYCFTILMPTLTIFLFRKINGFGPGDLAERKRRYVPFILTITSYIFCLLMMHRLNIPWYMTGIIFAALIMMIICVIVNLKWKLSEHMAGAGAIIGGLVAFSALFGYNPVGHIHPHRRRVGYGADHPPTPYAGRGNGRFRRRADLLPAGAAPVLQISIPFVQHILILNINS